MSSLNPARSGVTSLSLSSPSSQSSVLQSMWESGFFEGQEISRPAIFWKKIYRSREENTAETSLYMLPCWPFAAAIYIASS